MTYKSNNIKRARPLAPSWVVASLLSLPFLTYLHFKTPDFSNTFVKISVDFNLTEDEIKKIPSNKGGEK